MRKFFPVLAGISLLLSCTRTVPFYELEDKSTTRWIYLDRDTLADVGFFIDIINQQPGANASLYTPFEKLGHYEAIEVSIEGWRADSCAFMLGDAIGPKRNWFYGKSLEDVRPLLLKPENRPDSGDAYLRCTRRYDSLVTAFPEKLQLRYRVKTADTTVTGTITFLLATREEEEVIRIH